MSSDGERLTSQNVLLPSASLQAGRHYTAAVLWLSSNPIEPAAILAELRELDVRGFVSTKVDNGYWLIIEPQKQLTAGQLVLLGARYGAVFGVWDYRPTSEQALDARELIEDFNELVKKLWNSTKDGVNFFVSHWLAVLIILLVFLILLIYLILRRR